MHEAPKRPERIFRYCSHYHVDIFSEKKLWFSAVTDFNDIFEVVPRFDKLIEEQLEENLQKTYPDLRREDCDESYQDYKQRILITASDSFEKTIHERTNGFQEFFNRHYKILCFSEHLFSLLMWGHYTNCHKGFVIEFDPKHSLFAPRDFGEVMYENERPMATRNGDSSMLLRKSPEWAYEDEHRLIKRHEDLIPGKKMRGDKEVDGYFVPLPMEAVKAVYFGCRIFEGDREKILKSLANFSLIERFSMRRNLIEYKLDSIPFKG